ncbi:MAG: hypothetical protein IPL98_00810 [Saprospiraceae bacterium]|nr:hypothetical protein [Saprospiraceae bacterium]
MKIILFFIISTVTLLTAQNKIFQVDGQDAEILVQVHPKKDSVFVLYKGRPKEFIFCVSCANVKVRGLFYFREGTNIAKIRTPHPQIKAWFSIIYDCGGRFGYTTAIRFPDQCNEFENRYIDKGTWIVQNENPTGSIIFSAISYYDPAAYVNKITWFNSQYFKFEYYPWRDKIRDPDYILLNEGNPIGVSPLPRGVGAYRKNMIDNSIFKFRIPGRLDLYLDDHGKDIEEMIGVQK